MRINEWEILAIYHQPKKSRDHKHCDSGDMFLIYRWMPLTVSHHLDVFGDNCSVAIRDIKH